MCDLYDSVCEEIKRELKKILIYECRCNARLKAKTEGSTHLTYSGLRGGLEHLKIETRLRGERFGCVRTAQKNKGPECK